jgi:hypothetical protein
LQVIRSGQWQHIRQEPEKRPLVAELRRGQVSRLPVKLGGFVFVGFCVLSFLAAVSDGPGGWLIAGMGLGFVAAFFWRRNLSVRERGGLSSGCDTSFL